MYTSLLFRNIHLKPMLIPNSLTQQLLILNDARWVPQEPNPCSSDKLTNLALRCRYTPWSRLLHKLRNRTSQASQPVEEKAL